MSDWELIEQIEALMNLQAAYFAAGLDELAVGCKAELNRLAPVQQHK